MFRNQYDTDVTVWSPEGRLLQVEYAMESVQQGSACVGIRSNELCVLAALRRSVSEVSVPQEKIVQVDDHVVVGFAGLTADARSLVKYMQTECLQHKYVYGTPLSSHVLVADVADKHQRTTQTYVRRPFGVGLLLATVDKGTMPHLYQTCPSGNLFEYIASAMGARSQSARTYLEKHQDSFATATQSELIVHALTALLGCVSSNDKNNELTTRNVSVAVVGKDVPVKMVTGDELAAFLQQVQADRADDESSSSSEEGKDDDDAAGGGGGGDGPEAMET